MCPVHAAGHFAASATGRSPLHTRAIAYGSVVPSDAEVSRSSPTEQPAAATEAMTIDERAAVRAFLARCEVRLSTMHRVASALLSGAGLMVLLPAVERDAVVDVLRSLLTGHIDASKALAAVGIVVMLTLPFMALWMVLRDLIHFYFHSNHLHSGQSDVFVPRFPLTGLRLPAGELGASSTAALTEARADGGTIELLVPA